MKEFNYRSIQELYLESSDTDELIIQFIGETAENCRITAYDGSFDHEFGTKKEPLELEVEGEDADFIIFVNGFNICSFDSEESIVELLRPMFHDEKFYIDEQEVNPIISVYDDFISVSFETIE